MCAECAARAAASAARQIELLRHLQQLCTRVRRQCSSEAGDPLADLLAAHQFPLIDADSAGPGRGCGGAGTAARPPQLPRPLELSPDVFQLRAPISSRESLTPSVETGRCPGLQ